jgi:hypothetical protein
MKAGEFVFGAARKNFIEEARPRGEIACEIADRPVAAPDKAVPAKTIDRVFDDRAQGVRSDFAGGVGDDAGNAVGGILRSGYARNTARVRRRF